MKDKVIGIIGGMGPEATAFLFMKIIKATPVQCDQDHFRVIIDSNPKIPDRTAAILSGGESPVPQMIATAQNLEKAGVTVAGIPCITAHHFIDAVSPSVTYPVLNALEEVNRKMGLKLAERSKIGVLCTTGTMQTGLFDRYLAKYEILYPCEATQQQKVMEAVYGAGGVKAGNTGAIPKKLLLEAGRELIAQGAEVIIGGCTEIPLVLGDKDFEVPFIDPILILAQALAAYETSFA